MNQPVFALIDCNNFFVSCERLFRPDLIGKPVVVLSSNDGCAVSRSSEAKDLGIPMGAPAFKFRQLFQQHQVTCFSANFELYGDISRRIIQLLTSVTPRIEVYSVDESFLDLSQLNIPDYTTWAKMVRQNVLDWVGIPVSIGIAPTKTLAKLATARAKQTPELGSVLHLTPQGGDLSHHLAQVPVKDIWGVGWRLSPRLRAEGISNAEALHTMRPQHAQQLMGIHGRQMVAELNGVSCYPMDLEGRLRKSISVTRTFGHDTKDFAQLEAALTTFTTQAAFRLRTSRQLTTKAALFLTTSRHKPGYRHWSREVVFPVPTADTAHILQSLIKELHGLYNPLIEYHRAGVLLYDFLPGSYLQTDLLGLVDLAFHERSVQRMRAIDVINERFGKRSIRYASEDLARAWQPRQQLRSPRYTTAWSDLPHIQLTR
jgi:DNA polymerase V